MEDCFKYYVTACSPPLICRALFLDSSLLLYIILHIRKMTELIVGQMFRGLIVLLRHASDPANIAALGLLGEPEELHVFDELVFD